MNLDAPWLGTPEVQTLFAAFGNGGFELRFVGGCVRDSIMGITPRELDGATNAMPPQTIALLGKSGIRAIPTGIEHGTVTALVNGKPYEITTLRRDVVTDGRHAEVAFGSSWEEDARRRDFTMNALYVSKDGALHDYVNGLDDCKARRVRFIGDASTRIREDYLRILRYFRFVATVGDSRFDAEALVASASNKEGIASLSSERIQQELLRLLAAKEPFFALEQMQNIGILDVIFPNLSPNVPCQRKLASSTSPLLRLAALIGESSKIPAIAERLKLSNQQRKSLETWLTHAPLFTPGMDELSQKKLVRKLGGEEYLCAVRLAYALATVTGAGWGEGDYAALTALSAWQPPPFPVIAKDLMDRGYKEGKALGDKLRELEALWEESGYKLTREALIQH